MFDELIEQLSYGTFEKQGYLYYLNLAKINPKLYEKLSKSSTFFYYLLQRYGYDVSNRSKYDSGNIKYFNSLVEKQEINFNKYRDFDIKNSDNVMVELYKSDNQYFINMIGIYINTLTITEIKNLWFDNKSLVPNLDKYISSGRIDKFYIGCSRINFLTNLT